MIITELENGDVVWYAVDRTKIGHLGRTELMRFKSPDLGAAPSVIFGVDPIGIIHNTSNAIEIANFKFVTQLSDFPAPSGGVITLEEGTTYWITTEVDLMGLRIVASPKVVLAGGSSLKSKLKSTGLTGQALITSQWGLPVRFLGFEADIVFALNAGANPNEKIEWTDLGFDGSNSIGTIANYEKVAISESSFRGCGSLTLDGNISRVSMWQNYFDVGAGKTAIVVPASCTIGKWLRVVNTAFEVASGETALDVSTSATIPSESYVLDSCRFVGAGTALSGVQYTAESAQFRDNKGIPNTAGICQYVIQGSASATTIASQGTFYKVEGTTTPGAYISRFTTAVNNRATFTGDATSFFKVTATISVTGQNNRNLSFRVAKNGVTIPTSQASTTTDGVNNIVPATCLSIVQLSTGDYIEIFVANNSNTSNVAVSDMSVIIERTG